jgi:hypothetical protein
MRRLPRLLLPALLAVAFVAAPAAALADVAGVPQETGVTILAAEGEPTGPSPQERMREDNPARELGGYEDHETQFTWGAAWLLMFLGVVGLTALGGLYYLLVHRPAREPARR